MDADTGNLFASIPDEFSEEIFTGLAQGGGVTIERIVSRGHTSPAVGWYDQTENEWVIVLKGEAIISLADAGDVHLMPGDYLTIPAHRKHKVAWTIPNTETIWLAVRYE